ncbi:MAG: hypothetical protein IPJ60_12795 [Sphingobacteriaceae bacterium]|nr:hypothetical protein [Sphingobacteriaceae bacterium]
MEKKLGIAAKDTYQFYVKENKFHAVLEDDFFAPTRERSGRDVDDYSIQAVFAFIQRIGFNDKDFLKRMKESNSVPHYYHRWINMLLIDEVIPDVYAKETINIPGGRMVVNDIFGALNKK